MNSERANRVVPNNARSTFLDLNPPDLELLSELASMPVYADVRQREAKRGSGAKSEKNRGGRRRTSVRKK